MSTRTSASTLTQTWQVGPGRSGNLGASFEDAENTLTSLHLRSGFRMLPRTGASQRVIDLLPGTHSFLLEQNDSVAHRSGRDPRAHFEINVYSEGGFFVDVTGRRSALVNGRECFWARLRSGDEIQFGREKWVLEAGETMALEETVARTRKEVTLEHAVVMVPGDAAGVELDLAAPQVKAKPRAKLVVFVGMAALGMSLVSAYIGYELAKEQQVTFVATQKPALFNSVDEMEMESEKVIRDASEPIFDEASLGKVLAAFRTGRSNEACALLSEHASALDGPGIWAKKGRMLFERRCR